MTSTDGRAEQDARADITERSAPDRAFGSAAAQRAEDARRFAARRPGSSRARKWPPRVGPAHWRMSG
jgi:hypothetical protein